MANVNIGLHRFENLQAATQTADDIRAAGSVSYVDAEGATVNVTVGDVTVEDGS